MGLGRAGGGADRKKGHHRGKAHSGRQNQIAFHGLPPFRSAFLCLAYKSPSGLMAESWLAETKKSRPPVGLLEAGQRRTPHFTAVHVPLCHLPLYRVFFLHRLSSPLAKIVADGLILCKRGDSVSVRNVLTTFLYWKFERTSAPALALSALLPAPPPPARRRIMAASHDPPRRRSRDGRPAARP